LTLVSNKQYEDSIYFYYIDTEGSEDFWSALLKNCFLW